MGTSPKIEVRLEGDSEKIYRDGKYEGEITRLESGQFRWKNLLAPRIDNRSTNGTCASRQNAFLQLGFVLVAPKKGKKRGQ